MKIIEEEELRLKEIVEMMIAHRKFPSSTFLKAEFKKLNMNIKNQRYSQILQNVYFKGEISENQMCLVNIRLQIKAAKFSSIDPLNLTFDKPVIFNIRDTCVILKPESTTIRILGNGKISA